MTHQCASNCSSRFIWKHLEHSINEEFVKPEYRPMLMVEANPHALLDRFEAYDPPKVKKWISAEET